MPDPFTSFPWAKDVHTWDVFRGHFQDSWTFRVLYPWPVLKTGPAQEYVEASWARHMTIWHWFEMHAALVQVPQFEMSGRAWKDGEQKYDRLAAFGVFAVTTPN